MSRIRMYVYVLIIFYVSSVIMVVTGIIKITEKHIEVVDYEQKYDSLKQQLELQRNERIDLRNTVDSLLVVTDSLEGLSRQIQVEIREVPGSYNKFNSEELTNKMIEAYEQRGSEL